MMVNLRMTRDMEREPSNGLTVESTKAVGEKESNMELENSKVRTEE